MDWKGTTIVSCYFATECGKHKTVQVETEQSMNHLNHNQIRWAYSLCNFAAQMQYQIVNFLTLPCIRQRSLLMVP
jgi:hypothetical protein